MKLIEIVKTKNLLADIINTLDKAGFDVEDGEKENEIIFDLRPYLTGVIKIEKNKLYVVVQGYNNDIDIGEMDPKTLVKDLKSMNTKKWFKEWDPEMDD